MNRRNFHISLCIILVLCVVLMSTTAFAADASASTAPSVYGVDIPNSGEPGMIAITRAVADCEGGPHDMLSRGWGSIYNVDTGKFVIQNAACWQCTKCYLVIVTQGEKGEPIGYYTSWQPHEEVSMYGTIIRQSSKNILYTTSTTLPGVRFRYS